MQTYLVSANYALAGIAQAWFPYQLMSWNLCRAMCLCSHTGVTLLFMDICGFTAMSKVNAWKARKCFKQCGCEGSCRGRKQVRSAMFSLVSICSYTWDFALQQDAGALSILWALCPDWLLLLSYHKSQKVSFASPLHDKVAASRREGLVTNF